MSMEQNQLTRDLYAAGYTREDHPSFVYWSDWQNFGYLFEALLKFTWETPCGLLVDGKSDLGRDLACCDASFQGIDYCPENDNPLLRCPYERKDCPHSISGFPVPLCPCHTTGKRYSYEQSAERVESERSERQHRQYMEITGGAYCACVVGGNGYDGGHVEVQYDVEQCIRCRCQNPVCVIRKQKRDLSRANIFYDVRRTWITRIGFLEEKKVQVTKGERVFPHPVARTDAEIWLEMKKAHFNPLWSSSVIDSPHLTPEDRRQTFFSKMHRRYGEYDYFEFHYDVENIRIAKSEQRDLLQDLRDVADGLEVVHAVDLKKEQAAKKRESRQRRREQKERRLNKPRSPAPPKEEQLTLCRQNAKPERDEIRLVKQKYSFVYKAYSRKMAKLLTDEMRAPVPIYQAVLNDEPERFPGYERLLRRKRREYDNQEQPFSEMTENAQLADWIGRFQYWDAQNHAYIHLNPLQSHDVNLTLQKRYAFLQWEQGSGKTPAAIFTGKHRVEMGAVHSIWVISSAISIRNNWDVILKGAGFSYLFVERLADLQRIRPGDFVILTLNKVSQYKKQIGRYIKQLGYKIQFIFDESDNISNPSSKQTLSVLSCFRRCKYKLLTTGTSTRNNISEFAPQLELLYNNSINMISWCRTLYSYDKRSEYMEHKENPYYGMPIPAYKKGYRLFANSHLPEKITVFGVGQRNQDIYNADELDRLLGKTVITRTFEEVTGKDIRRIHQMPIPFLPEEREVYNIVLKEFYRIQREYYSSTGNSRKDALMRLIQQITLLLRISAAPDCMKEYEGETPLKEMAVVEALARWPEEVVAIGVRHTTVLDRYAAAIREYLPERPLFVVTGSTVTFAKRRALRDVLRDSQNGILLCTQQSLPSSVNFEFVNKIIIPEMHYNNAGMSQFYMRFVRYTSTEKKDLYFPIYIGSLESNLMQMVLAKEKLTMFMKGQDADMDEIYAKFGVDYDLLSTLMTRETDDEGHLRIHWGEQKIA